MELHDLVLIVHVAAGTFALLLGLVLIWRSRLLARASHRENGAH
jgi:hypothetical protein